MQPEAFVGLAEFGVGVAPGATVRWGEGEPGAAARIGGRPAAVEPEASELVNSKPAAWQLGVSVPAVPAG